MIELKISMVDRAIGQGMEIREIINLHIIGRITMAEVVVTKARDPLRDPMTTGHPLNIKAKTIALKLISKVLLNTLRSKAFTRLHSKHIHNIICVSIRKELSSNPTLLNNPRANLTSSQPYPKMPSCKHLRVSPHLWVS